MKVIGNKAILLRQENGEGGVGVPPKTEPTFDFDVEKVKSSGLFIPKDEFETTKQNYEKQLKEIENSAHKKAGQVLDNISKEIALLTGIERAEIENGGKKEREQIAEYMKRVLAAKTAEPAEKEKQIREIFAKEKETILTEKKELEQKLLSLRYNNELQGAMSDVLVGITDKEELSNSRDIIHALVVTKYPTKEYSNEYNRFIYKDSEGKVILNKLAEPISTNEVLAEVAKILPQKQQSKAVPSGLGNPKSTSKVVTEDDILAQLEKEGVNFSNPNFYKRIAELKKQYGLT